MDGEVLPISFAANDPFTFPGPLSFFCGMSDLCHATAGNSWVRVLRKGLIFPVSPTPLFHEPVDASCFFQLFLEVIVLSTNLVDKLWVSR